VEHELLVEAEKAKGMAAGGFCWLPPFCAYQFKNRSDSLCRVIWIRRRNVEAPGISMAEAIIGHKREVTGYAVDTNEPSPSKAFDHMPFSAVLAHGELRDHLLQGLSHAA